MQIRVRLRRDRLAALELRHAQGHITVAEAKEIFALREREQKYQSHRAWVERGGDSHNAARSRQWRIDNPGCS